MFFLGFMYGNLLEWLIHKYLFHGLGKKKNSIFSYHLKEHHVTAKKNNFVDKKISLIETAGMVLIIAVHVPVCYISTSFFAGIMLYAILFNIIHGYQHRNPEFCKKYMPWHWEHHMKNSNKNFGVVVDWSDRVFRTRKKYKD